jgi:hypothetical protein
MAALTYNDKSADAVWKEQDLKIDLAAGDKLPTRYTRAGTPSGYFDLKTFDLGALHVFVDGVSASTNVGLLEVKYIVDLFTPQTQTPLGGSFSNTSGLDSTHLVGTVSTFTPDPQAILPCAQVSTSKLLFLQPFEGLLYVDIRGTVLSANFAPVISSDGEVTLLNTVGESSGTTVMAVYKIRAYPGTSLTPTITATTVTGVYYSFAKAAYDSLS